MSSLVSLEVYKDNLLKYGVDLDLFCRMITGVAYKIEEAEEYKLKNAFINILSGSFDADKIDYITRDAQSTGISYQMLDVPRTINPFTSTAADKQTALCLPVTPVDIEPSWKSNNHESYGMKVSSECPLNP